MLREVVDGECVGGIWCASARVKRSDFQACSIDHSDISPLRFTDLRAVWIRIAQNPPSRIFDSSSSAAPIAYETQARSLNADCVRPPNVTRSLAAISLSW